jgi:hypothetical protein
MSDRSTASFSVAIHDAGVAEPVAVWLVAAEPVVVVVVPPVGGVGDEGA